MRTLPLAATLALFSAPAAALQQFQLELDPRASTVSLTAGFSVELPGSLIGDFDATTNPQGTRTVPGLLGGPGNEPVPVDLGFSGDTDFDAPPLGGLVLDADAGQLTLEVSELGLDLLGGTPATSALTLSLLYSTFRSYQPDSLYIGGIPLDLPLGDQAISEARLDQTAPALGSLIPAGRPGEYTLDVLVPVELSLILDAGTGPVPIGPLPVTLPLTGDLTLTGDLAQLSVAFALPIDQSVPDPLPGFAIDDLPLDLPTILPPGETAHLLLDATIASLDIQSDLSATLVAAGPGTCGMQSYCAAQPNSTGLGAALQALGTPDASANDLEFSATELPLNTMGFLVMSTAETFVPGYRGHVGNLCLGPRQVRFAQDVLDSGPTGTMSFAPDFDALPNGAAFTPGSTWNFQLWYRDTLPTPTWNSTDAVRVRFCASAGR